jgi:aspartate-semialdehyde dehydrogenase
MHELDAQWTKLSGRSDDLARAGALEAAVVEGEVWPKPIAGNVIPLAGSMKEGGYTSEEWKMIRETRKILHDDDIRCTVTCVRAPVYVGHAVSVNARFHRPLPKAEAIEILRDAPGVRVVDEGDGFPTPLDAAGIDPVLVGRVREDGSEPGSLNLWITGDNLRKGAALNAVQLAELLLAAD